MRDYGIGRSVPRTEDLRLLRGCGRYVDDLRFPDEVPDGRPLGIRHVDMPASPPHVWRAISGATAG